MSRKSGDESDLRKQPKVRDDEISFLMEQFPRIESMETMIDESPFDESDLLGDDDFDVDFFDHFDLPDDDDAVTTTTTSKNYQEQFLLDKDHKVFEFLTGKELSTFTLAAMSCDGQLVQQRLSHTIVRTRDRCAAFLNSILSAEKLLDFWNQQSNDLLMRLKVDGIGDLVKPFSEWCALYDYIELTSCWKGPVPYDVDDEVPIISWPVGVGHLVNVRRGGPVLLSTPFWTKEVILQAHEWIGDHSFTTTGNFLSHHRRSDFLVQAGDRVGMLSWPSMKGYYCHPLRPTGTRTRGCRNPLHLVTCCNKNFFGDPTTSQHYQKQHEWLLKVSRGAVNDDSNILCHWGSMNVPSEKKIQVQLMESIIRINKCVDADWQGQVVLD